MRDVVKNAILAKGADYFKGAYSPFLGPVTINRIAEDYNFGYRQLEPAIEVTQNSTDRKYYFYPDGKFDLGGDVMLFPFKGAVESDWLDYCESESEILEKMRRTLDFSDGEIKLVEDAFAANSHRPLSNYITEEKKMEIVEDVVNALDFDRIHNMMVEEDWKWASFDGFEVPSADDIKDNVVYIVKSVLSKKAETEWMEATGGIEVGFRTLEDPEGNGTFDDYVHFYVKFVFDEYETM